MGMAASQARLLCITARIHDVEYKAQSLQNAKLQLATQEDQVYQEYLEALDATTLTLETIDPISGKQATIAATFNNLCSTGKLNSADGKEYILVNKDNKMIVEDEIEEGYYDFTEAGYDDPRLFAIFMLNGCNTNYFSDFVKDTEAAEMIAYNRQKNTNTSLANMYNKLEELVYKHATDPSQVKSIYDTNVLFTEGSAKEIESYKKTLEAYRNALYASEGENIYNDLKDQNFVSGEYDQDMFNTYVDLYKQIKSCKGCVSISEYDGTHGDAANDSEFLHNMVQSGQFSIKTVQKDNETGEITSKTTSPGSDISLSYTATAEVDNTALKKAEAEYEHKLKQIDKKDKAFDLDLSKLETERTALTTEYESVKKVVDDNIDRTFKIFS